jgi:hypothetical protein
VIHPPLKAAVDRAVCPLRFAYFNKLLEEYMTLNRRTLLHFSLGGALARISAGQSPRSAHPDAVGSKFNADGSVRPFPGNTIISPVPRSSPYWTALVSAHDQLRAADFGDCFTLLPTSSYHMTVFDGVVDSVRDTAHWPKDLPLNAPLESCTRHFAKKLAEFDLGCEPPFRLRAQSFTLGGTALAFQLRPVDSAEDAKLRGLRDRLSTHLQLRKPDHDRYVFHVSMAYLVNWMTPDQEQHFASVSESCLNTARQAGILELAAPDFCTFTDMFAYRSQFRLNPIPAR